MNRIIVSLLAASFAGLAPAASAGVTGLMTPSLLGAVVGTSTAAQSNPGSVPESKLTATFSTFAGSTANAQSLVEGLRAGTTITLVDASNTTTSFSPPTKPMGWGNVKIALALARAELNAADITNPTPTDIQAALNGGTVGNGTIFTGVLTQRASGQGWGQIARAGNLNLGKVVSSVSKPAGAGNSQVNASSAPAGATGVVSASGKVSSAGSPHGTAGKVSAGVVTAAGPASQVGANGHGNGAGGKGVVTAAGPASQVASANGHGNGSAASLTTAGNSSTAGGVTSGAGSGATGSANHGHGKGHGGG